MSRIRPESDFLSRLALGLAILALLPVALSHYGVDQRDIMKIIPVVSAIVVLLFVDVLRTLLRKSIGVLGSISERLRAQRRSRIRFTPEWRRVEAARRRL